VSASHALTEPEATAPVAFQEAPPDPAPEVPEAEPQEPRLRVRGMCLSYAKRIVLDDLTLDVAPGEVLGLLGPNGSGKTSLLKCLTGLKRPDRGAVHLDGASVQPGARALRARLGVVFQESSLDDRLSCLDNLLLGAALFGISGKEARARARDLLVFMELESRGKDAVRTLSGGMRRRLELARALIHRPAILLLDEPTTGLDPLALDRTWQRLLALRRAHGLTLMLSTHLAEEAARCDRVVVLDRGRVVAVDTPDGLLRRVAGDVIALTASEPAELAADIVERLGVMAHAHGDEVLLEREAGHTWVPRLVEAFEPGRIQAISVRRPTLADAFFHLTGHGLAARTGERGAP
jgi:ABC-2 type transport system ATP-binding protein